MCNNFKKRIFTSFLCAFMVGKGICKKEGAGQLQNTLLISDNRKELNSFFQIELQESINRKASLGDIYKEKTIPQTLGAEGATN